MHLIGLPSCFLYAKDIILFCYWYYLDTSMNYFFCEFSYDSLFDLDYYKLLVFGKFTKLWSLALLLCIRKLLNDNLGNECAFAKVDYVSFFFMIWGLDKFCTM